MIEAPEVSAARLFETSYRFPSLKKKCAISRKI